MHPRVLIEKVSQAIVLLVSLYFLQVALLAAPLLFEIEDADTIMTLVSNSWWVANLTFGLLILWFARKKGLVAIPIAVLSVVLPIYGSIFYILMTLQNKNKND
jgi:hypothetical protein